MNITTKKINDIRIIVPKDIKNCDDRLPRHHKLFKSNYPNIFLCGKKHSGKTTILQNIIRASVSPSTKVIFFCPTVYKDNAYQCIKKMLDTNFIDYEQYLSIDEDNVLDNIISELQQNDEIDEKDNKMALLTDDKKESRKRKSKYITPDYIFIFDDISDQLRVSKKS